MSSNSIANISKCCLRRFSETRLSCDAIAFAEPFLGNKQQWRSVANSASKTKYPKPYLPYHSNKFSTTSSPTPPIRKGFLGWYLSKLDSHPVITKSVTSSIIYAAADFTSQKMIASPSSYDSIRTLRMAGFGLLILGPSQHLWFNLLSKILPKRDTWTTVKKILMGQTIFGPIINSIFFSYSAVLQGESGGEIVSRLKRDLRPTLINGLLYWPMCDFVTFKFVPVHLQPLVNSSFAYLWTIYLTHMANLKKVGNNKYLFLLST